MKSDGKNRSRPAESKSERVSRFESQNNLLIVAIGASAGGLEAITELLKNLPADTGMAFVLLQHLDPKHPSILSELVSKKTEMKVREVTDGLRVEPNCVYVIPPNATMSISGYTLQLTPREESSEVHMSIDHFMRKLAEERGDRAVGVILSGTGTDGTLGLAEIQAAGGMTFVQDETTAKFDGMPRSAIAAGCVDYILPPKGIARELTRIASHPYVTRPPVEEPVQEAPSANHELATIFQLLRRSTGVDFAHYRQTTILRRIQRRMVVHKMEKLAEYLKYVHLNPAEIKALYQDILINVTSFFRNPRVFEAMKSRVFPSLMKDRPTSLPIRLWIAGCASGEEAYSVAIALLEFLGDKAPQYPIQIFGTDLNESSIVRARNGLYPENIQGDVSPARLLRYFKKMDGGYRISKTIRDMCIFAQHNVIQDPPFSQMDMICCRNLLIYLEPVLQSRVLSLFHYATRPAGFLVLGASENVGSAANLFTPEDRSLKIFSKKATAVRHGVVFSLERDADPKGVGAPRVQGKTSDAAWNYLEAQKEFDRRLLTQYAPAAVFVNDDGEIIHTRGNVSRYLKLAPGRASLSILKMAREGLVLSLRNALSRAKKDGTAVRVQGVQLKDDDERKASGNGNSRLIDFEVIPIPIGNLKELYFMVVFEDSGQQPDRRSKDRGPKRTESSARRVTKLEQELAATKEYLQSVIEAQEATNEELQSANEEILSNNEELQSTNEELETAKEELQSANEELTTVNDELRNRNEETTTDLANLIARIGVAVVLVGRDLLIRRVTPPAQKIMGLIPADVGRPLQDNYPTMEIPNFREMVQRVVNSSGMTEEEVSDRKGETYLLRVVPYETIEGKIDGAVITLMPPRNSRV